ncbi:RNA 3'-terminal phosphate cyclase/enolpyruvate transferase, alpha/beta [Penicillium italicum]|uniref:RNA 3'-terminal phosphate cyclase/enolpyruvate transferase, alpha/beta n=1 Tax=Penicillium italicum TaxID=40296 RepID=A0A0A2LFK4_PENIT|nr:RNA 3'-terminal phosphate cyclase/enolpyruvate transferase, alpha/beta [Penicillium italicum]
MAASRSTLSKLNPVHLNGRTLEGGGQLVRIAIGLSALTGRPVSIDHVRGNREGKKGLKRSHAAAVKLLAEISDSKVSGGEVGSQSLNFFPQSTRSKRGPLLDLSQVNVKPEYDIKLTTAGAIFLVFQALYPYLLHVGSQAAAPSVKVKITGGTNTTYSPSYDYAVQVIVPNFAKLGLPPLSIILHKRGWTTGPVDLGAVTFLIHPLGSRHNLDGENQTEESSEKDQTAEPLCRFPQVNLADHKRGRITQIDITVLAPDQPTVNVGTEEGTGSTVRQFIEIFTLRTLRRETRKLDPSIFAKRSDLPQPDEEPLRKSSAKFTPVPITIHTSEATNHRSHVYILLVAHTSSGFKIGHDILGSMGGDRLLNPKNKGKPKQQPARDPRLDSQNEIAFSAAADLVRRCVEGFIGEISHESPNANPDQKPASTVKRACVDSYMRDQVVVFEALGKACHASGHGTEATDTEPLEDERDWTLHTKTAQWVCRQFLDI